MGFAINSGRLWGQKISVVVCVREGHHGISCFNQGINVNWLSEREWVILTVGALYSRSEHLICAPSYGEVSFVSVLATNHDPNDHDHFLVVPEERLNHGADRSLNRTISDYLRNKRRPREPSKRANASNVVNCCETTAKRRRCSSPKPGFEIASKI